MVAGQIRDAAKRREPIALLCRHVDDRSMPLCVSLIDGRVASFFQTLNQALIEPYVRTVRIEMVVVWCRDAVYRNNLLLCYCCAFSSAK